MKIPIQLTYMNKNKKSVGAEAAQISPKLSMSLPRLFPDTNALLFLPKNRLFVNENLKFMDLCCLHRYKGFAIQLLFQILPSPPLIRGIIGSWLCCTTFVIISLLLFENVFVTHELVTITNETYINAQSVCDLLWKITRLNLDTRVYKI